MLPTPSVAIFGRLAVTSRRALQNDDVKIRAHLIVIMTVEYLLSMGNDTAVAFAAPDRPALSHGELRRHIVKIERTLGASGLGRTDRVAIVLSNGPEMATTFLAVSSCSIAAPLNPRYSTAEFDFYLRDLNPKALIVEAGRDSASIAVAQRYAIPVITLTARMQDAAGIFDLEGPLDTANSARSATPSDVALLLHTSGTTGRPKLVPLTHGQLCASARNVAAALALTPADRGLHVMPLFHIHGLVAGLLAPLYAGGDIYCTAGFDVRAFGGWLDEARPTWLTAVPTMHQAILEWARREPNAARRAKLRFLRSCSAALPPTVATGLEDAFGAPVIEAYAMTEAAHQISSNPLPPAERHIGSVGTAAGPEITILDGQGAQLPLGEAGEVAIRGENVISAYVDNPGADAAAFVQGWFRTGDLGTIDADGYLRLIGRLKEMINRGGEKIAPIEIESHLLAHPAVAQAVVFPVPHATLGEEVAAAIVLRDGQHVSAGDLQSLLLEKLSLPKIPRRIVFVADLPKGPTGKLRRIGLAATFGLEAVRPRPPFVQPRSPLERTLAEIWCEALTISEIGVDDNFFDLGGDSLAALQIAAEILSKVNAEISLSELLRCPTIADLALEITEQRLLALAPESRAALLDEAENE